MFIMLKRYLIVCYICFMTFFFANNNIFQSPDPEDTEIGQKVNYQNISDFQRPLTLIGKSYFMSYQRMSHVSLIASRVMKQLNTDNECEIRRNVYVIWRRYTYLLFNTDFEIHTIIMSSTIPSEIN